MINDLMNWYRLSGLSEASISVPLVETSLLFIILTLCLLFRYSRTGMLVAYIFVYRWGWNFRGTQALPDRYLQVWFTNGYIVCGLLVFVCAVIGMLYSRPRD